MKEIEKRLGLQPRETANLKKKINSVFTLTKTVRRTILIKTGKGFVPDPTTLVDIKVKLIDNDSILAIKHGVWHADAARQEYETRFERTDLANLIAGLTVLSYDKFILLSTLRSVWEADGLIVTLDEYTNAGGKALLEIETADNSRGEADIDQAFARLGVRPMGSAATITFISEVNQSADVQIDLLKESPEAVAALMVGNHP